MSRNTILVIVLIAVLAVSAAVFFFSSGPVEAPSQQTDNVQNKSDLIKVTSPKPNDSVSSPVHIAGEARGNWFFEATFPIKLLDDNGDVIAQSYAQATSDWMTTNFVPFTADLAYASSASGPGTLVLEKDNPSGLSKNDDELRIPVSIQKAGQEVKLYYYNPSLDKDALGNTLCGKNGLVAVERAIPTTQTPIQDTIKLLIKGDLTQKEISQGLTTEYPLPGFSLLGASLNSGVLTLQFSDPNMKTSGGACRAGILWAQIAETAKQFPGVEQVRFTPEDLFQP